MRARLMVLAAVAIFLFSPLQPGLTAVDESNSQTLPNTLDLPSALLEDDSFEDLPFEQLRQALREEVEYDPQKKVSRRSSKRYNLLIR